MTVAGWDPTGTKVMQMWLQEDSDVVRHGHLSCHHIPANQESTKINLSVFLNPVWHFILKMGNM